MSKLRVAVTGTRGQIASSLIERAAGTDIEVLTIGRPSLDLSNLRMIVTAIEAGVADVLISAAGYTDVNKAESEPELADVINSQAAGRLAARARDAGIPIIHLSTDYVFDGEKAAPYRETDPVRPLNVYGHSKARGEQAVAAAHPSHVILRTCWVYSPFNRNFVKTMLDLAARQPEVRVVSDQVGNPTSAADIADGILAIARQLAGSQSRARYGTFHMAAAGAASWAEFAEEIFAIAAARGGPAARVVRIPSSEYPTPAKRPHNSQLDCARIAGAYAVILPDWRRSLPACIDRILGRAA